MAADPFDMSVTYFVESDEDPTALIARRPGLSDGYVWWEDTNRERGHEVKTIQVDGDVVTVATKSDRTYRFRPLTLALYDERVRAQVELSPTFESTEALQSFYRETAF